MRRVREKWRAQVSVLAMVLAGVSGAAFVFAPSALAADLPGKKDAPEAPVASADPWSGFFVGGSMGYAWGHSGWSGAGASGSLGMANHIDTFDESGSFSGGLQAGYNFLLPNRVLLGVEADANFPASRSPGQCDRQHRQYLFAEPRRGLLRRECSRAGQRTGARRLCPAWKLSGLRDRRRRLRSRSGQSFGGGERRPLADARRLDGRRRR